MMQDIMHFFKKNGSLVVLLSVLSILLAVHQLIFLYGDDYHYGTYVKMGFQGFWESHAHHYLRINGRAAVHFIVSLLLFFDVYLWRILNPLLIGSILLLITKIAGESTQKTSGAARGFRTGQSAMMLLTGALLFLSIDIQIGRESIYWLDGSMNYLYPMGMLFLAYWLYRGSLKSKKSRFILLLTCFLSGATVEQAGLMTVGLLSAECFSAVMIEKKRPAVRLFLPPLAAVLGYATVALAPGTFVRGEVDSASISLQGLYSITEFFLLDSSMFVFILLTSIVAACWLFRLARQLYRQGRNKIIMLVHCLLWTGLLAAIFIFLGLHLNWLSIGGHEKLFLLYFTLFALLMAYAFGMVLYMQQDIRPLAFYLAGIGAQLMMVVAPVPRHRTLFCSALALCVPIIIGLWSFRKTLALAALPGLLAIGLRNISSIGMGYASNYPVNQYNLQQIHRLQAGQLDYAVLRRMTDDRYCFTPLQTSNYHIAELVKYYGLPSDSVFIEPNPDAVQNALYLNGQKVMMNFLPVRLDGQYYVSAGELARAFHYTTQWDELAKQVTMVRGGDTVTLTLGSAEVSVNGRSVMMNSPVLFRLNRNLVPIEFFEKIFDCAISLQPNQFGGVDIMITNS